ncbi:hypothetical protein [Actinomadura sediminis]|uniref:Uncharacterized protein n=1 Tax=Actinomadura sediminis TaxID=1038904 RepID=A0ABW3EPS6_9ACTN
MSPDEAAADLIARHLNGRLAPHIDPRLVAAHLVDLLREHGWRPIPRPEPITAQGPGAPPTREWREVADRIRNRQEDPR